MAEISAIKLLVLDSDGVLTDGSIIVDDLGIESRRFHVRDGFGIKAAQLAGLSVGVISGRCTRSTTLRLADLGVGLVVQGQLDKGAALATLCQRAEVQVEESAFLGDDLIDLPALHRCGYPMAVADAVPEVQAQARFVTAVPGGRGAAREAIEHILRAQGKWAQVVAKYGG